MADRGKYRPSTYRFSEAEQRLMDRLGALLAPPGLAPLRRVDVIRLALHRLALSLEPEPAEKKSGKPAQAI